MDIIPTVGLVSFSHIIQPRQFILSRHPPVRKTASTIILAIALGALPVDIRPIVFAAHISPVLVSNTVPLSFAINRASLLSCACNCPEKKQTNKKVTNVILMSNDLIIFIKARFLQFVCVVREGANLFNFLMRVSS